MKVCAILTLVSFAAVGHLWQSVNNQYLRLLPAVKQVKSKDRPAVCPWRGNSERAEERRTSLARTDGEGFLIRLNMIISAGVQILNMRMRNAKVMMLHVTV